MSAADDPITSQYHSMEQQQSQSQSRFAPRRDFIMAWSVFLIWQTIAFWGAFPVGVNAGYGTDNVDDDIPPEIYALAFLGISIWSSLTGTMFALIFIRKLLLLNGGDTVRARYFSVEPFHNVVGPPMYKVTIIYHATTTTTTTAKADSVDVKINDDAAAAAVVTDATTQMVVEHHHAVLTWTTPLSASRVPTGAPFITYYPAAPSEAMLADESRVQIIAGGTLLVALSSAIGCYFLISAFAMLSMTPRWYELQLAHASVLAFVMWIGRLGMWECCSHGKAEETADLDLSMAVMLWQDLSQHSRTTFEWTAQDIDFMQEYTP